MIIFDVGKQIEREASSGMEHITGDGKFILPKNEGILFEHDCLRNSIIYGCCIICTNDEPSFGLRITNYSLPHGSIGTFV